MVEVVPVELPGKFSPQEHPKKDGKPNYVLKYIKMKAHLTTALYQDNNVNLWREGTAIHILKGYFTLEV